MEAAREDDAGRASVESVPVEMAGLAPELTEESMMVAGPAVVRRSRMGPKVVPRPRMGSKVVPRPKVVAKPAVLEGPAVVAGPTVVAELPIPLTTDPPLAGKRKRKKKKNKACRRRKHDVWLKRIMCYHVSFFLINCFTK